MSFPSETLPLQAATFALLRDLVHEKTGQYFPPDRRESLADRLSPLLLDRGIRSFLDYYYFLKYDATAASEWGKIFDFIAVPETYFYREIEHFRTLTDHILPALAKQSALPIRIWSAACAGGEEPLSIAMALNESGWLSRHPIEIVASDASPGAVERARRGEYRGNAFRALPVRLKDKYFSATENAGVWRISKEMHSVISFSVANLVEESQVAPFAGSTIVFCRNVFIYFSEDSIRLTLRLLSGLMPAGGYLFVGVSESLFRLASAFELIELGAAFVYLNRKGGPQECNKA